MKYGEIKWYYPKPLPGEGTVASFAVKYSPPEGGKPMTVRIHKNADETEFFIVAAAFNSPKHQVLNLGKLTRFELIPYLERMEPYNDRDRHRTDSKGSVIEHGLQLDGVDPERQAEWR